jgi:hypothetical protein
MFYLFILFICNYKKDRLDLENREAMELHLRNLSLDADEFLRIFPEPYKTFYDETPVMSAAYTQHALTQLSNDFPFLNYQHIEQALTNHHSHYTPAYHELAAMDNADSEFGTTYDVDNLFLLFLQVFAFIVTISAQNDTLSVLLSQGLPLQ